MQKRTLVVDTDVISSAGGNNRGESLTCAATLDALVKRPGIRIAFCDCCLGQQYAQINSSLGLMFLAEMRDRRRLKRMLDPHRKKEEVETLIISQSTKVRPVMRADRFLVEIAMCQDRRIISKDVRARHHFQQAISRTGSSAELYWGTITAGSDAAIRWIEEGLPRNQAWLL